VDPEGKFLGQGFWSPKSALPVRILERNPERGINGAWFGAKIEEAYGWRGSLLGLPSEGNSGYRLINGEGDGLAGLVVDIYGDVAAVQFLTYGMKLREREIVGQVARVARVNTVIETPSGPTAKAEGFEAEARTIRGPDCETLSFTERDFAYEVPTGSSQKTGYYFDQRANREMVERMSRGRRVLDAFCYTGSFSLAAARGGATEVLALDRSISAITTAARAAERNGLGGSTKFAKADIKKELPTLARAGERFDVVFVDPPKLAPTSRHLQRGRRAYRRLNANAMRLVEPNGILVTCSCSAAMRSAGFMRIIGMAARDAGREVAVLHVGEQAPDHPSPVAFPEGRYLKAIFLRVI